MRIVFCLCLLLPLLFSGCNNPAQSDLPPVYYDVGGFVNRQITDLSARKPLVQKAVQINQERSQQTVRTVNWQRELELFLQADINKPALRSSYAIARPDSLTYRYTLKNSEERLTVRSLLVKVDSVTRQPRRIEAVLQTSNPLYASERHLLLESGPTRTGWQVNHYKLYGFQKLSFFDKNEFSVEARIQ